MSDEAITASDAAEAARSGSMVTGVVNRGGNPPPEPGSPEARQEAEMVKVLTECVNLITGDDATRPRPSQEMLAKDVFAALQHRSRLASAQAADGRGAMHAIAEAPTGTGKSFAYLVPAYVQAARSSERTVISTASLSLMDQLLKKDLPVVSEATKNVLGSEISFAGMKGWSNYICTAALADSGVELLDDARRDSLATHLGCEPGEVKRKIQRAVESQSEAGPRALKALLRAVEDLPDRQTLSVRVGKRRLDSPHETEVRGFSVASNEFRDVMAWALQDVLGERVGDRHGFRVPMTDTMWGLISTTPNECLGASNCPFASQCRAVASRKLAADADVVVTNHAVLGVQAAKNVPLVIGSDRLGFFDSVVVDECHELPSIVRDQGSASVSPNRMKSLYRALARVMDEADSTVQRLKASADAISDAMRLELQRDFAETDPSKRLDASEAVLGEGDEPLRQCTHLVSGWLSEAKAILPSSGALPVSTQLDVRKALNAIAKMSDDVKAVTQHNPDYARWIEKAVRDNHTFYDLKFAPVDVGGVMAGNLWQSRVPMSAEEKAELKAIAKEQDDAAALAEMQARAEERVNIAVVAVSATIPATFRSDAGMSSKRAAYPSPFAGAFARSAVFVPKVSAEEVEALSQQRGRRKRMDTTRHAPWARMMTERLVRANGGSALVLTTSASNGKDMAAHLRDHVDGLRVLSQWDGASTQALMETWKNDEASVLVATRSFMTGVDAPGETCTLVVIDRVPRNAPNPVDNARAARVAARTGIAPWIANERIYGSDASALLRQAVGRLIRRESDDGMVAILDPRLLQSTPLRFSEEARSFYEKALAPFSQRITDVSVAESFLVAHRRRRG